MNARKQAVLDAIDAANSHDPNQEDGQPVELLYGQRMSAELDRLFPDASDPLLSCGPTPRQTTST